MYFTNQSNSDHIYDNAYHPNILTALRAEKVTETIFDPNSALFSITAIQSDNSIELSVDEMIQYIEELTEFVKQVQKLND